jgi:hypothetical protein
MFRSSTTPLLPDPLLSLLHLLKPASIPLLFDPLIQLLLSLLLILAMLRLPVSLLLLGVLLKVVFLHIDS